MPRTRCASPTTPTLGLAPTSGPLTSSVQSKWRNALKPAWSSSTAWSHRTPGSPSAAARGRVMGASCPNTGSKSSPTSRRSGSAPPAPTGRRLPRRRRGRNNHRSRGRFRRPSCLLVLAGHDRVAVPQCVDGVEAEAPRHLRQHLRRALELDKPSEVEHVERDRDSVEHPVRTPLRVGPADPEPELLQKVQRRVNVGDVNLGLLADLDASFEGRRTLCGEDAAWAAVEHAKPQRRVAGRLARPVETVVVLLVAARQLGAALAEHRAKLGVVACARDAKPELRLDGAVSWRA